MVVIIVSAFCFIGGIISLFIVKNKKSVLVLMGWCVVAGILSFVVYMFEWNCQPDITT